MCKGPGAEIRRQVWLEHREPGKGIEHEIGETGPRGFHGYGKKCQPAIR